MARRTAKRGFLSLLDHTLNPVTLGLARTKYGPFSLIRHVGRKSGRIYETPLILARAPEGFVAELTYGENVNWYRNTVAAGGCVVVRHRVEYRVDHIGPYSAERGRSAYPAPFRLILRVTRRNEFRMLHIAGSRPLS